MAAAAGTLAAETGEPDPARRLAGARSAAPCAPSRRRRPPAVLLQSLVVCMASGGNFTRAAPCVFLCSLLEGRCQAMPGPRTAVHRDLAPVHFFPRGFFHSCWSTWDAQSFVFAAVHLGCSEPGDCRLMQPALVLPHCSPMARWVTPAALDPLRTTHALLYPHACAIVSPCMRMFCCILMHLPPCDPMACCISSSYKPLLPFRLCCNYGPDVITALM